MALACFRRAQRDEDRPEPPERESLEAIGADLRLEAARLAATSDGVRYWVVPARDGRSVLLCWLGERGGGGESGVTLEALKRNGAAVSTSIHRGAWRYVLLVADGFRRVRIGPREAAVTDNVAVLDLPDRERFIELLGPSDKRTLLDLGPSDWDEFDSLAAR